MTQNTNPKTPAKPATPAKSATAKTGTAAKAPAKTTGPAKPATKAPVKSGTAAKSSVKTTGTVKSAAKTPTKKKAGPKIAVYIDIENTNASRDNLLEVLTGLNLRGAVMFGKLYGYEKGIGFDDIVAEHGLETVGRTQKDGGDSVIDTRLVIDCMLAAGSKKFEYIFVWAGVGDIASLFKQIKQQRCKTFTLDIPGYDIPENLIDQKMRLFSPLARVKASSVNAATATQTYTAAKPVSATVVTDSLPPIPTAIATPTKQALGAIASDNVDDLEDFEILSEDDFKFDESELEGLQNLDDIADDYEDYDDNLEDFSDIGGTDVEIPDEVYNAIKNADNGLMNASENERLLALTNQMLRDLKKTKKGKPLNFDVKKAAKELGLDDESLGIPPITEEEKKSLYGSAGFSYAADDAAEAPDDREKEEKEGPDEFSDFGKV